MIEGGMDVIRHTVFDIWHDVVLHIMAMSRVLADSAIEIAQSSLSAYYLLGTVLNEGIIPHQKKKIRKRL